MDISSSVAVNTSTSTEAPSQLQTEVLKKAQDTDVMRGQQDLKILEDVAQKSQEMTAQKTGVGGNLNITG